jgi:imidazolonepropionase-like amidohydrolase
VQMNVGPLWGREDDERQRAARALLRSGLPTVIGTDAHPPGRPYTLRDGWSAAVREGLGEDEAAQLVAGNPASLLDRGIVTA